MDKADRKDKIRINQKIDSSKQPKKLFAVTQWKEGPESSVFWLPPIPLLWTTGLILDQTPLHKLICLQKIKFHDVELYFSLIVQHCCSTPHGHTDSMEQYNQYPKRRTNLTYLQMLNLNTAAVPILLFHLAEVPNMFLKINVPVFAIISIFPPP